MRERDRGGIKEFGTRILRSNGRLGGTLALPLGQITGSICCRCRCRRFRPRPQQKAVAIMQLEPPT